MTLIFKIQSKNLLINLHLLMIKLIPNIHLFNKPEHYSVLFVLIKYLRMFNMLDLSIAL